MNNYGKQIIHICTKITDEDTLTKMVQPIIDFGNKHGIVFYLGFNKQNELISTCEVEGYTSAYCKGMMAEVKQMLKDIFKCKLNVLLYAF